MFEVLLAFCRCSEAPIAVCSDPHSPVSYTVMLPANGAAERWLLNEKIPPGAVGNGWTR